MSGTYTACWKNTINKGGVPDPHLFEEKLTEGQAPISKNGLHGGKPHIIQLVTIVIDNNKQAATLAQ